MPFYEYECQNCKFYTELLQKVSDPPLKKCPSCGKSTMKKLVSAPVFRLKGGGWYETDFKGDKENKRNLAVDKEPEASSSESKPVKPVAGSDAKADTKAADAKPAAESKSSESGSGASSGESSGKSESSSRSSSASKSRAKAPPSRSPAKSKAKAKPAARRRGR